MQCFVHVETFPDVEKIVVGAPIWDEHDRAYRFPVTMPTVYEKSEKSSEKSDENNQCNKSEVTNKGIFSFNIRYSELRTIAEKIKNCKTSFRVLRKNPFPRKKLTNFRLDTRRFDLQTWLRNLDEKEVDDVMTEINELPSLQQQNVENKNQGFEMRLYQIQSNEDQSNDDKSDWERILMISSLLDGSNPHNKIDEASQGLQFLFMSEASKPLGPDHKNGRMAKDSVVFSKKFYERKKNDNLESFPKCWRRNQRFI